MRNALILFASYLGVSVRSQMQYRASFLIMTLGHFASTGIEVVGIWVLFGRFQSLEGWTFGEVALFYGITHTGFALAEALGRGFDTFGGMVKGGGFDRILLRPRGLAFQLAASHVQIMRIGRLAQGLIVLGFAAASLGVDWTAARVGLVGFAILGGMCSFYGLYVLQALISFWSTETLELMNTLSYGGTEACQYPLAIYRPWFRKLFTFVVPLACTNYFPAVAIIGKVDPLGSPVWFQWTSPVFGILFLFVCLQLWKIGVRHYQSTGS